LGIWGYIFLLHVLKKYLLLVDNSFLGPTKNYFLKDTFQFKLIQ